MPTMSQLYGAGISPEQMIRLRGEKERWCDCLLRPCFENRGRKLLKGIETSRIVTPWVSWYGCSSLRPHFFTVNGPNNQWLLINNDICSSLRILNQHSSQFDVLFLVWSEILHCYFIFYFENAIPRKLLFFKPQKHLMVTDEVPKH